ncbi:hypothetical protein E2562_030413 [Oryza meyeriana var. granulata]|uniref:Uncharacterized protein n=1 Tax=Oryza meyeriana var. granulata TaxID=110450 RepID=A0A6G1FDV8_9ORYZ|nr:hypothetical protein E2562_030413 [Oryza meyeriana var. granulata]
MPPTPDLVASSLDQHSSEFELETDKSQRERVTAPAGRHELGGVVLVLGAASLGCPRRRPDPPVTTLYHLVSRRGHRDSLPRDSCRPVRRPPSPSVDGPDPWSLVPPDPPLPKWPRRRRDERPNTVAICWTHVNKLYPYPSQIAAAPFLRA